MQSKGQGKINRGTVCICTAGSMLQEQQQQQQQQRLHPSQQIDIMLSRQGLGTSVSVGDGCDAAMRPTSKV